MKLIIFFFVLTGMFLGRSSAWANKEVLNGGDICEDRIKIIRDDIKAWIVNGGSKGLKLPQNISLGRYNSAMLNQIQGAHIRCVDDTIKIEGVEKTCKNIKDPRGKSFVVCNRKSFLETTSEDQYILVHHEYAGLSGVETNDGEVSHYIVSNQISEFLETVEVTRLSVKPQNPPATLDIRSNFKDFVGQYHVMKCTDEIVHGTSNPEISDCGDGYPDASLFFGDDYQPREGGRGFFLTVYDHNNLKHHWRSDGIAYADAEIGDLCSTFYGSFFCDSKKNGYVMSTSVKVIDGLTYVDWVLSWPSDQSAYMYHKMSAVLKRASF